MASLTQYSSFKAQHDLEERKRMAQRTARDEHLVPVIVEKSSSSRLPELQKKRLRVSGTLAVGKITSLIRKNLSLAENESIFLFVGNTIPSSISTVRDVYNQHADEDGFLYIVYQEESVFGQ